MKRNGDIDDDLSDGELDDDGDEGDADGGPCLAPSGARQESGRRPAFLRTTRSIKVWMMVAGIFVLVAIGVLYIYQAGDRRTVLGNQPIPAGQVLSVAGEAPPRPPKAAQGAAASARAPDLPSARPAAARPNASSAETGGRIHCPRCLADGLPVCSSCGAAMQPMGDASSLYVCPVCGAVGVPICPRCGAHMVASDVVAPRWGAPGQGAGAASGQFQCTSCGATGLPNWNAAGVPLCAACGGTMAVR